MLRTDLRSLPAVQAVLEDPALGAALAALPRTLVVEAVRAEIAAERARLQNGRRNGPGSPPTAAEIARRAALRAAREQAPRLRRVLNATGIVLHTNLGRAPLSNAARRAVDQIAQGYSSLEFDLDTGKRGQRGTGVETWLTRLTGAEAALVVNNGAGAILLALSAIAQGKGVIVSRGELVEIGGSFRVPEIMEKSGARLIEVGSTNRTHLRDYERAFERSQDIAAILKVHRSNFRIEGFTAEPSLEELAKLAKRRKVALIEDLGSGALVDLARFGLEHEPTATESLTRGCDVVTFSGDKLLGGSQAGIVLGRKARIECLRKDPLARALRADKLVLAALEATLPAYADPERAAADIPVLGMLQTSDAELEQRARALAAELTRLSPGLEVEVERGIGEVGGGSLPKQKLKSWVVAVSDRERTADMLDELSRGADPPVIGYIRGGRFRLDVRTLTDTEAMEAAAAISRARETAGKE